MQKLLTLICVPLLVFISLERVNISLLAWVEFQDMGYYIGDDAAVKSYNEAVLALRQWQTSEAKSLLQTILNGEHENPADVYELYGDLVYESRGSTGDVAVFYNRSLEYLDNPRVRTKLALLDTLPAPTEDKNNTNTATGAVEELNQTGALERTSRRQELAWTGRDGQQMIDLTVGMTEPQDAISRTLDILSGGTGAQRDW